MLSKEYAWLVISNNDSTLNIIKIIETSSFHSPHNHNPFLGDAYKVSSKKFIKYLCSHSLNVS
jgi:hypothetical protein